MRVSDLRTTILLLLGLGGCWHAFPEGVEAGTLDRGLDTHLTDRARSDRSPTDRLVGDRASELAGSAPCNLTTATLRWISSDGVMAVCESKGPPRFQCKAEELCAAGRQLCLATRYQQLAGEPPNGLATGAWLSGHVRNGANVGKLSNAVCLACAGDAYQGCPSQPVATACSGGANLATIISTTECSVGLVSASSCWLVGTDKQRGYWEVAPAWEKRPAALCCKS